MKYAKKADVLKEKQLFWGKEVGGVRYMKTHLRDGSLSISNPIKALDTFRCHGKP